MSPCEAMSAGQSDIAAMLKLGHHVDMRVGDLRGVETGSFSHLKLIVKAQMDNTFGTSFVDWKQWRSNFTSNS